MGWVRGVKKSDRACLVGTGTGIGEKPEGDSCPRMLLRR